MDRLYHQITGKGGQAIPPILAEQLLAIVDAFTDDQIERAAGPSASARSPVKYFISLFNVDAGTTKVDSPKTNGDRGDWLKSHGGTIHSRARSDEGFTRFADIDHPGWLTLLGRISDIPEAAHPALAEALVEKHSR